MLRASNREEPKRRRRAPLFLLAGLAATLALVARPTATAASDEPRGVILFTGNVIGFLEECGCPKAPLGGLDKRAGYVEGLKRAWPRAWRVLLDAGNFSDSPGPVGQTKTRGLVEAMTLLEYSAAGVGERDLRRGPDNLGSLAEIAEFPFLSANLTRRSDGAGFLPPSTVIEKDGVKIGVVAATRYNPMLRHGLSNGDALVTSDPVGALPSVVADLERRADLVVLLALFSLEDARHIARQVPGLDAILGAHGDRVTADPIYVGDTLLLYAGDEGKYLGQVEIHDSAGGGYRLRGRMISLYPSLPSDDVMLEHVFTVLAEAQEAERLSHSALDPMGEQAGAPRFLGSGGCTACHADIVTEWSYSGHARAFRTLVDKKADARPACVACHSTGFGQSGGYLSRDATPHLKGVGCESCHGSGGGHVAQPDRPYGKVTIATCTSCHTADQDPDFSYYESLPLVNHGASPKR